MLGLPQNLASSLSAGYCECMIFATNCLVPVLCGIGEWYRCCILKDGILAFRANSSADVQGLRYLSRYWLADSKHREQDCVVKCIGLVWHCCYSEIDFLFSLSFLAIRAAGMRLLCCSRTKKRWQMRRMEEQIRHGWSTCADMTSELSLVILRGLCTFEV